MGLVHAGGPKALTWHWSPNNGFALNHPIRGWNECLIAYVLAASSPRYGVPAETYHEGWAAGPRVRQPAKLRGRSSCRSGPIGAGRSSSRIIPSAASTRAA